MKKIIEKCICKNFIKILKTYQNSIDHNRYNFKNYLDRTIYFEIDYLIRLVKERGDEANGCL